MKNEKILNLLIDQVGSQTTIAYILNEVIYDPLRLEIIESQTLHFSDITTPDLIIQVNGICEKYNVKTYIEDNSVNGVFKKTIWR